MADFTALNAASSALRSARTFVEDAAYEAKPNSNYYQEAKWTLQEIDRALAALDAEFRRPR